MGFSSRTSTRPVDEPDCSLDHRREHAVRHGFAWLALGLVACGSAKGGATSTPNGGASSTVAGEGGARIGSVDSGGAASDSVAAASGQSAGQRAGAGGGGSGGARSVAGGGGASPNGGRATGGQSGTSASAGSSAGGAAAIGGSDETSAGMAGEGGQGENVGTGGTFGTGARTPVPETGPELTDVSVLTPAECTITSAVVPAADMPFVGVATFSADLAGADHAVIQFGQTTNYTLEAPVDWSATDHKTWLLGMPADTVVHYRVVVMQGTTACVGSDASYRTGAAPSGAPASQKPQKGTSSAPVAPGFIIAETGNWAYIVDTDGQVVWAHLFPLALGRALLSWDGKYMYARDMGSSIATTTGGSIYRIAMDGSDETLLPVVGGSHHDLVAIPTGFAYLAKTDVEGCDHIFTADADGSNTQSLVDLDVVFGHFLPGPDAYSLEHCHVDAIRYYKDNDTYSVSDREKDAIAFFTGKGELLGSIGAPPATSTPNHVLAPEAAPMPGQLWRVQHGHDLYEPDKLVLWSNGMFNGGTSHVLHYTIKGSQATLDWQYTGAGTCPILSDVQHLPNGNFLVTNSGPGAVQEIDSSAVLVQAFSKLSTGYCSHRTTLYGVPPGR